MQSSSPSKPLVLLLLRFLLYGVGAVEVGCMVRCLLWRLVGPVCYACFLALCGVRAIRVGSFCGMSWLEWVSVYMCKQNLESKK